MEKETIAPTAVPQGTTVDRPGQGISGLIDRVNEHRDFCDAGKYKQAERVIQRSCNPSAVVSAIAIEQSFNVARHVGARVWNYARGLVARLAAQDHLSVTERDAQEADSSEFGLQRTTTEPKRSWLFIRSLWLLTKSDEVNTETKPNPFAELVSPER